MSVVVRNATRRFGDCTALDDVSVEIPGGSLTALLGPAGSGRSTLLRVIVGLERPDSGTVEIDGRDATAVAPQRRGVGFVSPHDAAFEHMTVRENVAFGLKMARRPRAEVRARVDELLELAQLPGLADRYPAQLSGGQRQRMALARSLATRPSVLLLDEPFGALDARVRHELRGWLRRLHDEVHVTCVFVTHDEEEAMEVADRIVVMNGGRIEQVGGPRDLYEHPANAVVMGLVGPVTRLGELFLRPHDLEVRRQPNTTTSEAMVERLVHLGFEVRADLVLHDGQRLQAQLSREEAEELELARGQIVFVRPSRTRRFAEAHAGERGLLGNGRMP
jgi:sulfate transport system ATP-binding protein